MNEKLLDIINDLDIMMRCLDFKVEGQKARNENANNTINDVNKLQNCIFLLQEVHGDLTDNA